MLHRPLRSRSTSHRRGSIVPMVTVSLVVLLLVLALAVDTLWVYAARLELQTASDGAALAAARELASDDLLKSNSSSTPRIKRAQAAAVSVATQNRVAGQPVSLRIGMSPNDTDNDLRFGTVAATNGLLHGRFVPNVRSPLAAVVTARRSYSRSNPLALFFWQLSGVPAADVRAMSVATINNCVVGVQASLTRTVPALPIGILMKDTGGGARPNWQATIIQRQGNDQFAYDLDSRTVASRSDGIPEIVLQAAGDPSDGKTNACLLMLNPNNASSINRQITSGWSLDDLAAFGGRFSPSVAPVFVRCAWSIPDEAATPLRGLVGECRIVPLYVSVQGEGGQTDKNRVQCVGLAAGRILRVLDGESGCQLIFQPGVIATHSAIVGVSSGRNESETNSYIYKLQLTAADLP